MSTIKVENIQNPSSGTNDIQIDVNGNVSFDTDTLYIDATNNRVGVRTTSPLQPLHVKNAGSTACRLILENSGSTVASSTQIYSQNNDLVFDANSSERARIDSSGRLLVGTASARAVFNNTTGTAALQVEGSTANTANLSITRTSADTGPSLLTFAKSRGSVGGTPTVVASGDLIGFISFEGADGTEFVRGASISAEVDGTPGANDMPGRLVFSTTADGAGSPTVALTINRNQELFTIPTYTATTASAANVVVFSNGNLARSTSSAKYKTDIETIEYSYSDALLQCRPVWYRSTTDKDNPEWGWWGFIAEEVAAIDPRLVHWKTVEVTYDENSSAVETPCEPEPEGVAYDRFVPHLLNLIKRQKEQIEALEARLTAAGL